MSHLYGVVILATVLEVIYALPPAKMPAICNSHPSYNESTPECCVMPPVFSLKDLKKCGFPDTAVPKKRFTSKDCPKYKCVAKKYNLLKDGEMEPELFYTLLNNYVEKNPSFKSAVASAKETCIGKQLIGMESCPPEKVFSCVFTIMLYQCPGWQTDPRCAHMKDFMRICPPYIFKF